MNAMKLVLLASFISTFAWATEDASSIFKTYAPNIVQIESSAGVGTGFFYTNDIVISNRHVVFGFDGHKKSWYFPKKFFLKDGTKLETYKFMICSKRVDLCVISIAPNTKVSEFKFSNRDVKPGEDVYVIGHPRGIEVPVISTGIVSSNSSDHPGLDYKYDNVKFKGFTTNASISQGSSGSPVISKEAEIIGLISSTVRDAQNLNIAITSNEINTFIENVTNKKLDDVIYLEPGFETKLNEEFSSYLRQMVDAAPAKEPVKAPAETTEVAKTPNEDIRKVLISNIPRFKACYQRDLDDSGNKYSGNMNLKFIVGPKGLVTRASTVTKDALPSNLRNCIIGTLEGLKFPEPANGGSFEVSQPINFFPKKA